MKDLTFIIPIGPTHERLADRAIASARQQSVACEVLAMVDSQRQGPGVVRNRLLQQVATPFVTFLDADDWVEPTWAEETLAEYARGAAAQYIFTDWVNGRGEIVEAPCTNGPNGGPISATDRKPYCGGTWHAVTTLLPTDWVRAVGGFDESLPAVEDTDFYLKLCTTFRCGRRLARPLFHYSPDGGRAATFRGSADYDKVMGDLTLRYGGKMGCCGDKTALAKPIGERQPDDVLAMALWHGNRTEFGRVTRRNYPRLSYPRTAWVDPRDVKQSPQLWQIVEQPAIAAVDQRQGLTTLSQIAGAGMATVVRQPYAPPAFEPEPPPVQARPDAQRLINLGRKQVEKLDEPIFVFPEKHYDSYADVRRLVTLSGFSAISVKEINVFSRQPYIVLSPEPIPNLNGIPARVICWQLEYAGDTYTENYKGFAGEVWASDKAWAAQNNAKYVLMGSHPGLPGIPVGRTPEPQFDVTMLGYMVPRRQAIKDQLGDLRWPADYPGHQTPESDHVLYHTSLMLHIHQFDNAPYVAPQRIAIAAAYHMPILSETVSDPGDLAKYMPLVPYANIPAIVHKLFEATPESLGARLSAANVGEKLHDFLCVQRPFRTCVMEALKS